ncbi:phage virion morphogenesis protein [Uruburuella testudinis]|uniref:Phage virion morphogenesis protein n=1 Tax=Uruburuella testudinis TaxID=1282863 RepID=A0ABY4DVE3_9NEIS|nr:phage virion morphogenesis protein [Uruburuella testudinis]UOO82811.1 phage virion morphogenesis protein [Uruburuella testudinis]
MIEINLDTKSLDRSLSQLLINLGNSRKMMRAIATEMSSITEENFESESWGSDKWKQSKRAADGGKTLQLTGQLAASISTQVGNDFARIGSNKPYAAIHHLGGQAGRDKKVTIPARPYLPINGSGALQSGADKRILDIAIESLKAGL